MGKTRRQKKVEARMSRIGSERNTRKLRRASWAAMGHDRPVWVGEPHTHRRMYLPYEKTKYGQWSRPAEHTEEKIKNVIAGLPKYSQIVTQARGMITQLFKAVSRRHQAR